MPSNGSTVPVKCLNCQAELASPIVCTGCQSLFPAPQSADYFDLLGLERRYAIDEAELTSAFRAITRNIHPDRFTNQPDQLRLLATRLSAELNQAMRVLKDPVQRAGYLLELMGGRSATEMRDVPGTLLAEVMMLREELEEARSADNPEALITRLRSSLEARRADTLQQIASRAEQLATSSDEEKKELRKLLNSVKYFDNLLEELVSDPLAHETGVGDG